MAIKLEDHWIAPERSLVKRNTEYLAEQADKILRDYLRKHLETQGAVEEAEFSEATAPVPSHSIDIYA